MQSPGARSHVTPRVEHARLDGVFWRPNDLCDLVNRLFVVADEIDVLPVQRRQLRQALLDDLAAIFLMHRGLVIVARVHDGRSRMTAQLRLRTAPQRRNRLVTRDRQQPGRDPRFRLEPER